MPTFHTAMKIEQLETAMAEGATPQAALGELARATQLGDPLAKAFQGYLGIAGISTFSRETISDRLLLDAFRAAVRQVRVKRSDISNLHLQAEMEATKLKRSLERVTAERDEAKELVRSQEEELRRARTVIEMQAQEIKDLKRMKGNLQGQLTKLRRKHGRVVND